ncbi:MAG: hypothetical protein JXQ85_12445 [Cognatishimia sp.]|uniref:hypothetical protein n=1 Tax=Cognatishimia sp. TaxID=2211648 RepID=UPI003B8D77DE
MRTLMDLVGRAPHVPWVILGLWLIFMTVWQQYLDWLPVMSAFAWQLVTGLTLLGFVVYQWILLLKRMCNDTRNARFHMMAHRWVGVAATYMFILHAVRMGHTWTTGLAMVFFLLGVTGVLNRQVLKYRQPWIHAVWQFCHIGLSAVLLPLVIVHIWVALAYQ